jgi:RNA polymerase sigma-70 factor (ECF subfamily)
MDEAQARRLYGDAGANRWELPPAAFADALERSAARAFAGRTPEAGDLDRYFGSLHLPDLALACACALGHEGAWDHFVAEFRPALYRSADAIDPGGGAREVADALYADLFGLKDRHGVRPSLFLYFHGRSSLVTWLRSLLTQRYVDRVRAVRRLDPLPDDSSPAAVPARPAAPDLDRPRFAAAMRAALAAAMAALAPRDRLRLGCYYAQEMTLAQIGRLTGEHEATVSRHLTRTRRTIRDAVEQRLRDEHGFGEREITECFASLSADAGTIDLGELLPAGERKNSAADRSLHEDPS